MDKKTANNGEKLMKHIITFVIVAIVATIFITACDKETYVHYIVEGRIIDKDTREPANNILVSFVRYDDLLSPEKKTQKHSPPVYDGRSDENGEFRTVGRRLEESDVPSLFYIYGEGLYKDTTILVDFSNVTLSGTPAKNYKGEYVLSIGDIGLTKQ